MNRSLSSYLAEALIADRLREAERFRRARAAEVAGNDADEAVTVRLARPADADAVVRLSELGGRPAPGGTALVAEVGGEVVAARSLEDGASVADPFKPTTHLDELLALRATHLSASPSRRRRGSGRRVWRSAARRVAR